MIIIDEYLAVRVVGGDWPAGMPDDQLALPTMGQWRLLQAMHHPRGGQLSQVLAGLSEADRAALRFPHPEVLQVLDLRPLLDHAARLAARYRGTGLRNAEILAAGLAQRADLWFGHPANIGAAVTTAAADLGLAVQVAT